MIRVCVCVLLVGGLRIKKPILLQLHLSAIIQHLLTLLSCVYSLFYLHYFFRHHCFVRVVGSWAWNWMEPPLGQVSLPFARSFSYSLIALFVFAHSFARPPFFHAFRPWCQVSFFLLCLQFARSQIANLGVRPYTAKLKAMRADKIVRKFPQYDATLLADYSKNVNFY